MEEHQELAGEIIMAAIRGYIEQVDTEELVRTYLDLADIEPVAGQVEELAELVDTAKATIEVSWEDG